MQVVHRIKSRREHRNLMSTASSSSCEKHIFEDVTSALEVSSSFRLFITQFVTICHLKHVNYRLTMTHHSFWRISRSDACLHFTIGQKLRRYWTGTSSHAARALAAKSKPALIWGDRCWELYHSTQARRVEGGCHSKAKTIECAVSH